MKAYIQERIKKDKSYFQLIKFINAPKGYVKFQREPEVLTEKEFNEKFIIEKKFEDK